MTFSRIGAGFLFLLACAQVAANPTVTGNVISWPDDGWYQVQAVTDEGIIEICQGGRSCEVNPGTYIVINHTTRVRFEGVIVSAEPETSGPTIAGNTISWPDDGWYQVQAVTDAGIFEVCQGTRFCEVPDGEYIVINHTTGMRYEGILVNGPDNGSEVTVTGNTISWTDDGWYQVQAVTDAGIIEICQGTRFCEVPDGQYIVINHTTGERFEPVIVKSDSTDPDPEVLPIISAQNWQEILRNVIDLINADRALERHAMVRSRFSSLSQLVIAETLAGDTSGSLASLGLTQLPLADPNNNLIVDYACNAQGTLNFNLNPGVSIYDIESDSCAIDGDGYDGGFNFNGVGREGLSSRMDNMIVTLADGTAYALDGSYSTSIDRVGVRRSEQWTEAATAERSGNDNYIVESFNLLNASVDARTFSVNPPFLEYSATAQGSFSVSANWSESQALQVTVDLNLGGTVQETDPNLSELPSQWSSGSIDVIAPDGSRISLRPIVDDTTSALVIVSEISEPQQIQWSDGYQVRCFADPEDFPDCQ